MFSRSRDVPRTIPSFRSLFLRLISLFYFQRRFNRELRVWSEVNHQYLLPLLGVCYDFEQPGVPCLVSPYYHNGSIIDYIKNKPNVCKLTLVNHVTNQMERLIFLLIFALAFTCRLGLVIFTQLKRYSQRCKGGEPLGWTTHTRLSSFMD